jgi:phospholipid transport system substrate-binding protein
MSPTRTVVPLLASLVLSLAGGPVAIAAPDTKPPAPAPAPVPGKLGPGSAAVKQANEALSALLKQKVAAGSPEEKALAAKMTTSVRGFLDIDQLGKRAMADQKLTPAQLSEFLDLLRALIEDNYIKGLRANLDYQVNYTGETSTADGDLLVTTKIETKRHGRPYSIEVDYVVKKDGATWKAWDVKTDGVGLVDNYRTQFNKIIERDKFEGLIAKMKAKQASGAAATPPATTPPAP